MRISLLLLALMQIVFACQAQKFPEQDYAYKHLPLDSSLFQPGRSLAQLTDPAINEASGLAASRTYPGVLWTLNDSGNEPNLFAIDTNGNTIATLPIRARNRDWEDLATGPGPDTSRNYLFIAETGDNEAIHDSVIIYRLSEPNPYAACKAPQSADTIKFRYPDGARDAETLLIDPRTRDWFIVTKREDSVRVYRLPYPQQPGVMLKPSYCGSLPLWYVTGGSISPDGAKILLKTYPEIFYFERGPDETLDAALFRTPKSLPYVREPQGEAVAWAADCQSFYTLSEERANIEAVLYKYTPKK